jgi:transposase-like protein
MSYNKEISSFKGRGYPWDKKVEVVTTFLSTGNLRLTSKLVEVPYETIQQWRKQDWWVELQDQVKRDKEIHVDAQVTKIVDKSLELVQDRLENGDFIMNNKTGQIERRPVSLRDVSKTANDLMTRQAIIKKMEKEEKVNTVSMQDTLKMLATEFSKWAKKKTTDDAVDVEFKELDSAIHEKREEGLQT